MLQTGLIDKIIEAIENPMGQRKKTLNAKKTLADTAPLSKSADSPPHNEDWDYRAVVGMLLYLSTNSRPDLAFAVSQVARFTHNPKKPQRRSETDRPLLGSLVGYDSETKRRPLYRQLRRL
jgi:hypothetical protein